MNKTRVAGLVLLLLIVFGLGTGVGLFIQRHDSQSLIVDKDSIAEFRLIEDAWNITRTNYVDRAATQPQTLAYGGVAGMIDSLGDTGHSTFLTPEEVKQQNEFDQGTLQGIGIEVQVKNGNVVIIAPLDNSPAQKAGLRPGDVILKVNGQTVADVADAVRLILGPAGSSVTLTVQSPAGATRDVTVVRATINLVSVNWCQLPGSSVADLRISSFTKGVSGQLDNALSAIRAQGSTGVILDLRDNPGGLLDEAIAVASRFVRSGNVLLEKNINGKITPDPVLAAIPKTDLPLIVLINQGTASAAEIVAAALHDSGRAKLLGETTFGTGTVLNQFSLADGSALLLAVQEWLTPNGNTIWHVGLAPDELIAETTSASPLFPEVIQGLTAQQLSSSGDQQLLRGIEILSNPK